MERSAQIANHFREVYFNGNRVATNLKDVLKDINQEQATKKVNDLNTIAALVYHIHYYIRAVLGVVKGGPLDAHDRYSFDLPPIADDEEWQNFLATVWQEAAILADRIEALPDEALWTIFSEEKYGTYYKNFWGIIEHSYYHLGQIVLLKKLLNQNGREE
ncbi:MAG: DUF1572 domain-containing protein [Terrimonas sp.]|nr:DUF1572 domain-containing protein [Terrimonas sp.]